MDAKSLITREDLTGLLVAQKYRVMRPLGHGPLGTVYLCQRELDDAIVALKVLHAEIASAPGTLVRFWDEIGNAAQLHHPNVVTIAEFGEDLPNRLLYVATEHVEGRDLIRVLDEDGPQSDACVVDIASQVLEALSAASSLGLVHGGLKPSNVLIERARDAAHPAGRVLVRDFGHAQLAPRRLAGSARDSQVRLHQVREHIVGTPEYFSPEHARGAVLDSRSDIYATGVILYQLLTRTLPFTGANSFELALKHCGALPPPPSGFGPVNRALEAVCLKALCKTREARFQTPREMQQALKGALAADSDASSRRISLARTPSVAPKRANRKRTLEMNTLASESEPAPPPNTRRRPNSLAATERELVEVPKQRTGTVAVASAAVLLIAFGVWQGLPRRDRDAVQRPASTAAVPASEQPAEPASAQAAPASAPTPAGVPGAESATSPLLPQPVRIATEPKQLTAVVGMPSIAASDVTPTLERGKVSIVATFTRAPVPAVSLRQSLDRDALNECYQKLLQSDAAPAQRFKGRLDIITDERGAFVTTKLYGERLPRPLRSCVERVARGGGISSVYPGHITASIELGFDPS